MVLLLEPYSVQWWLWMTLGVTCLILGMWISTGMLKGKPKPPPPGLTAYNVYRSVDGLVVRSTLPDEQVSAIVLWAMLATQGSHGWSPTCKAVRDSVKQEMAKFTPHKVDISLDWQAYCKTK